ncbi:hypothetical protein IMZ48_00930 [Candidatus Bathyarchaeota archaeon]|nr:hypothetical protein [Candidatus Bathyarchaeota archaeon]
MSNKPMYDTLGRRDFLAGKSTTEVEFLSLMIHYHAVEVKQKRKIPDRCSDAIITALSSTGASHLYNRWTDGEITRLTRKSTFYQWRSWIDELIKHLWLKDTSKLTWRCGAAGPAHARPMLRLVPRSGGPHCVPRIGDSSIEQSLFPY